MPIVILLIALFGLLVEVVLNVRRTHNMCAEVELLERKCDRLRRRYGFQ